MRGRRTVGQIGFIMVVLVGAAAVAASNAGAGPSTGAVAGGGVSNDPSAPAWLRYWRPATSAVVTDQVRVPMRDGVGMRCDLFRPAKGGIALPGPYPALVSNFFAYRALQRTAFGEQGEMFAGRGYAVLLCSPRGSRGTPGEWSPFGPQDRQYLYDLIECPGTQGWSSGKVGQTGISYGGVSASQAGTPPAPPPTRPAPLLSHSPADS